MWCRILEGSTLRRISTLSKLRKFGRVIFLLPSFIRYALGLWRPWICLLHRHAVRKCVDERWTCSLACKIRSVSIYWWGSHFRMHWGWLQRLHQLRWMLRPLLLLMLRLLILKICCMVDEWYWYCRSEGKYWTWGTCAVVRELSEDAGSM